MASSLSQFGSALGASMWSYIRECRSWGVRVATRYAVAVALFLAAGAGMIAAVGVGLSALLFWLTTKYGAYPAYGIVTAALVLMAAASALIGLALMKRALPPVPSPKRRAAAASRAVAAETSAVVDGARAKLASAKPAATQASIGLAAISLLAWAVTSRIGRRRRLDGAS